MCTPSRLTQLRKKRDDKSKRCQWGITQLALRVHPDDALEDRGSTLPNSSNVATPTKPIITIPTSIYGYGNGDDAEEGVPRERAMGGSMGSTSATNLEGSG